MSFVGVTKNVGKIQKSITYCLSMIYLRSIDFENQIIWRILCDLMFLIIAFFKKIQERKASFNPSMFFLK